eukprot:5885558-Pyramimonas_sp.AAC.1
MRPPLFFSSRPPPHRSEAAQSSPPRAGTLGAGPKSGASRDLGALAADPSSCSPQDCSFSRLVLTPRRRP